MRLSLRPFQNHKTNDEGSSLGCPIPIPIAFSFLFSLSPLEPSTSFMHYMEDGISSHHDRRPAFSVFTNAVAY